MHEPVPILIGDHQLYSSHLTVHRVRLVRLHQKYVYEVYAYFRRCERRFRFVVASSLGQLPGKRHLSYTELFSGTFDGWTIKDTEHDNFSRSLMGSLWSRSPTDG